MNKKPQTGFSKLPVKKQQSLLLKAAKLANKEQQTLEGQYLKLQLAKRP